MANALAVFNVFKWTDQRRRDRWMRLLMIILPLGWAIIGVAVSAPLVLVLFGGILNAIYLIGVAISTVYLSRNETDPRVKGGTFMNVMMWISAFAIMSGRRGGPVHDALQLTRSEIMHQHFMRHVGPFGTRI